MNRRRKLLRLLCLLPLLLATGGCGAFYQAPEVRIVDLRLTGLGITSGTAELEVEVDNPNRFALEVRRLEYLIEVSDGRAGSNGEARWDTLAVGVEPDTVRVAGRSAETVTLRIPFRYQALGVAFRSWLEGGDIPYRVVGEVRASGPVGTRDLPFRSEGSFTP
jgi:LEA14-like dessication related protein